MRNHEVEDFEYYAALNTTEISVQDDIAEKFPVKTLVGAGVAFILGLNSVGCNSQERTLAYDQIQSTPTIAALDSTATAEAQPIKKATETLNVFEATLNAAQKSTLEAQKTPEILDAMLNQFPDDIKTYAVELKIDVETTLTIPGLINIPYSQKFGSGTILGIYPGKEPGSQIVALATAKHVVYNNENKLESMERLTIDQPHIPGNPTAEVYPGDIRVAVDNDTDFAILAFKINNPVFGGSNNENKFTGSPGRLYSLGFSKHELDQEDPEIYPFIVDNPEFQPIENNMLKLVGHAQSPYSFVGNSGSGYFLSTENGLALIGVLSTIGPYCETGECDHASGITKLPEAQELQQLINAAVGGLN